MPSVPISEEIGMYRGMTKSAKYLSILTVVLVPAYPGCCSSTQLFTFVIPPAIAGMLHHLGGNHFLTI